MPRREDRRGDLAATPGRNYSASPVFADGRIYFLAEQGVTTVIAPGRVFSRLASNTLDGGLLASMAISGGSLFLRTDSHLYRVTERAIGRRDRT